MYSNDGTNIRDEAEIIASIRKAKEEYLKDLDRDAPSSKAAFTYATALVRSKDKFELGKAIDIFDALIDDGFQTHKCIYNIAYAYYQMGQLRNSRLYCERLLKLDPLNEQAQSLHQELDAIVKQKGYKGLAVTTLLVAGVAILVYRIVGRR